ncbi:MAG: DUF6259 domain-containing protein [Planctomycetota bacterium]
MKHQPAQRSTIPARPATLLAAVACVLVLSSPVTATAADSVMTDFERKPAGWREPGGGSGVVAEPGNPRNHVYRIVATQPHHTLLSLQQSAAHPNFSASLRVKRVSHTGEPPVVYVYGRHQGGFRGLAIRTDSAAGMAYYGQEQPSAQLGRTALQQPNGWLRVKLICFDDRLAAKIWPEGTPEPRWQIQGAAEGQPRGLFAVGVWTSPQKPSQATVLFDDIRFEPVTEAELAELELQPAARPPLPTQLAIGDGGFETATDVGLASEITLLAFDRTTGSLSHLVHRGSARDFVSPQSFEPLFTLGLSKPYEAVAQETTALDFRKVEVFRPAAGQIELQFSEHLTEPLTARVAVRIDDRGLVRMRIRVGNGSAWAVGRVDFPQFLCPPQLGDEIGDDRLLLPLQGGVVVEAPGHLPLSREARYPGAACVQLTAFYDTTAGLLLSTFDPDGHCKLFAARAAQRHSIELPLGHLRPEIVGEDDELPYDVVLGTFTGDWRDAAELYKDWALQQPWCATKLAERSDLPQFLKDGSGIIIVGIRNPQGYNGQLGPDLTGAADFAAAYRKRTDLKHIVLVPYGWEGRGTWAGINYFPAVPSNEAWQQANAALRAQGDRVAMLTSGYWWVVKRKDFSSGPDFDDTAQFERQREMLITQADGQPWLFDNYENLRRGAEWRGLSARLCHGSDAARAAIVDAFLGVARLGTPLVSFDQEIGGGQDQPCYSRTHGHPSGNGNWMWTGFRDACREILARGKPVEPELGLFMENTSELAIPYMATYWSRQFGEIDHGTFGGRGIGLFSYLYHEYVTAIGAACVQGQGLRGTRPSAELRCHVLANNLTRGLIPGPFVQDVPLEPKSDWHHMVSQAFFSYCRPYRNFPEYLLLGRTTRPPEVECASHAVGFYRPGGSAPDGKAVSSAPSSKPGTRKAEIELPTVGAGSFVATDGSTGTVLVNHTNRPQRAVVRLPERSSSAVLYRADRTMERELLAGVRELSLQLEPFGTLMLVTHPVNQPN